MSTRAQRQAVVERQRAALARGSLSRDERVAFDEARAWEVHKAEKRRAAQQQLPKAA